MVNQRYMVLDYESRSEADIKEVGAWEYSQHPSTEIICAAWRVGTKDTLKNAPVNFWVLGDGEMDSFTDLLKDPTIHIVAHNVFFERSMTANVLVIDTPIERWTCTAARAAALALPRNLENACLALNLPVKKDMAGRKLMLKMCKPRNPTKNNSAKWHETPEDLARLGQYCVQDVKAETELLFATPALSPFETRVWQLDQNINTRGVEIDENLADKSIALIKEETDFLTEETQRLTDGKIRSLAQRDAFLEFIQENGGMIPDLKAKTVSDALSSNLLNPLCHRLLEMRQSVGKTSTAKYDAFKNRTNADGRVREVLVYHGASTGRWSGSGVQVQNFPRGNIKNTYQSCQDVKDFSLEDIRLLYGRPMDVFASNLRGCIIPADGKTFYCGDYAAIEVRVLFWMAGHADGLKAYAENRDLYREMASIIYRVKLENVTKDQREIGKRAILGSGYNMGHLKFAETCKQFGIEVTEELAETAIKAYRETHYPVTALWKGIESCAIAAVRNKGKVFEAGRTKWEVKNKFLWCTLPSGRKLAFYAPEIRYKDTPWGDKRPTLYHYATNSVTKQWGCEGTYGGRLVENIVQATARDLMADAMLRLEDNGYEIKLSVHDELLTEKENGNLKEFTELMASTPSWAEGLPVKVDSWEGNRYRK